MIDSDADVLVIGGGVAGAACALRLRQRGVSVDLVEKETFPRTKVCGCCIGPNGVAAIAQLGLIDEVRENALTTDRWRASLGGRQVQLNIPAGIVVSREALDSIMWNAASAAGANVSNACTAKIESTSDQEVMVSLTRDQQTLTKYYRCVVIAGGLKFGGLNETLPWSQTPHGPFGVATTARSNDIEPGVIYMACDRDGYVGMVKMHDGRINIAAALRWSKSREKDSASSTCEASFQSSLQAPTAKTIRNDVDACLSRVNSILQNSVFRDVDLCDLSPMMTTPRLRRRRKAGQGRLMAIGDAAGYVEPFTGEGMTWGMEGGIAAADLIADRQSNYAEIGQQWESQLGAVLKKRQRRCSVLTTALASNSFCRIAAWSLQKMPVLAQPFLRL